MKREKILKLNKEISDFFDKECEAYTRDFPLWKIFEKVIDMEDGYSCLIEGSLLFDVRLITGAEHMGMREEWDEVNIANVTIEAFEIRDSDGNIDSEKSENVFCALKAIGTF